MTRAIILVAKSFCEEGWTRGWHRVELWSLVVNQTNRRMLRSRDRRRSGCFVPWSILVGQEKRAGSKPARSVWFEPYAEL